MKKSNLIITTLMALLLTGCQKPQAETGVVRANNIDVQISNAHGEAGKKIVNLTVTPANATITYINWEVDKDCVVINKLTNTSAEVYVTDYMSDYATITVTEQLSGTVGTGKVYSYAKTQMSYTAGPAGVNMAVEINEISSPYTRLAYWEDTEVQDYSTPVSPKLIQNQNNAVKVTIYYKGSYAPDVYHIKSYPTKTYVSQNTTKTAGYGNSQTLQFTINLDVGITRFFIAQTTIDGAPDSWYPPVSGADNGVIGNFSIERAQQVQGMAFDDITFFD